eukprot:m.965705 g.965705  ORF g.965705 m.965705 type:complete len:1456 (-) comp23910_c0_seq6:233-4600(-)
MFAARAAHSPQEQFRVCFWVYGAILAISGAHASPALRRGGHASAVAPDLTAGEHRDFQNIQEKQSYALVWGPSWNLQPPVISLQGTLVDAHSNSAAVSANQAQVPVPIWENYAVFPRAVEYITGRIVVWADTGGSLFAITTSGNHLAGVAESVTTLIARNDSTNVDDDITGLAYNAATADLYYCQGTAVLRLHLTVNADGTRISVPGAPVVVRDFHPLALRNLVVDFPSKTAFACRFDDAENRSSGSVIRFDLDASRSTAVDIVVNTTLPVASSPKFGDTLPRFALDLDNDCIYVASFILGISRVSLTAPYKADRVVVDTGYRTGRVYIAVALGPYNATWPRALWLSDVYGNLGAVGVEGGVVEWFDGACSPGPGCRYKEIWDMKVIPPAPKSPGTQILPGANQGGRILAAWARIYDMSDSGYNFQVISASIRTFTTNATAALPAIDALYQTYHNGQNTLVVQNDTCSAMYTTSYGGIYSSGLTETSPEVTAYTYKNFRFMASIALDSHYDRLLWFQQYDNPRVGGDNGYAAQLMVAPTSDLNKRQSVLSMFCNSQTGTVLSKDPHTGDIVFQSSGTNGFSGGIQHFCVLPADATKAPHLFFVQDESYSCVNVAMNWTAREMYLSGVNYYFDMSQIVRVSVDTVIPFPYGTSPTARDDVTVIASNTTATAMAVVGDGLYFVWTSKPGYRGYQTSVLYHCPHVGGTGASVCNTHAAQNLSTAPTFVDQFGRLQMWASDDGATLVLASFRGNSIQVAVSTYAIKERVWSPLTVTPFYTPSALALSSDGSVMHYADNTLLQFGSFELASAQKGGDIATPYTIDGSWESLLNQSVFGFGFTNLCEAAEKWYWTSVVQDANGNTSIALFASPIARTEPLPDNGFVLTLSPNKTLSTAVVVDPKGEFVYYVISGYDKYDSGNYYCGPKNPDVLIRQSLRDPESVEVVYENKVGYCFGKSQPVFDEKNGRMFYSTVEQYSDFNGYDHLAVLDLNTKVSTMLDWGYPQNTGFKQLRLNHDATALWGLGCVANRYGEGCASRIFKLDLAEQTYVNGTLDDISGGTAAVSYLLLHPQKDNEFYCSFSYGSSSTPSSAGIVHGVLHDDGAVVDAIGDGYGAAAPIATTFLLAATYVNDLDFDWSDPDGGLVMAPRRPGAGVSTAGFGEDSLYLVRGPLGGTGTGTPLQVIDVKAPAVVPRYLLDSSVSTVSVAPDKAGGCDVVLTFGTSACTRNDLWHTTITKLTATPVAETLKSVVYGYGNSITIAPEQFQAQPDGQHRSTTTTWLQCSSRVVTAELPEQLSSATPLDARRLGVTWMNLPMTQGTSIAAMVQVSAAPAPNYVIAFANGSVVLVGIPHTGGPSDVNGDDDVIQQLALLSNETAWLPRSLVVAPDVVYLGEVGVNNRSIGRIRHTALPVSENSVFETFLDENVVGAASLALAPASCLPPQHKTPGPQLGGTGIVDSA